MASVIINEFLSFVQNKIDVLDELSIVQICATNFTDTEVEEGKSTLFTACGDGAARIVQGKDSKSRREPYSAKPMVTPKNSTQGVPRSASTLGPSDYSVPTMHTPTYRDIVQNASKTPTKISRTSLIQKV